MEPERWDSLPSPGDVFPTARFDHAGRDPHREIEAPYMSIRHIPGTAIVTVLLVLAAPSTVAAQVPVYLAQWGTQGSGPGQFLFPAGVVADANGAVYVSDHFLSRVEKFTSDGILLGQIAGPGSGPGQLYTPYGLAIGPNGRLVIADSSNDRIQVLTLEG